MDDSKSGYIDRLGVIKIGKNIRKSPLHRPNFANTATKQQQPQPQVYNITKNDFRNAVQQLTGSPSQDLLPRPALNSPQPHCMRMQKIRPPPLTPAVPVPTPAYPLATVPPPAPYNNSFAKPGKYEQPLPTMLRPTIYGDVVWANVTQFPISTYMRYLQTALLDPSPVANQGQPQAPPPSSSLLPNPPTSAPPSLRVVNGSLASIPTLSFPPTNGPALLPSPTGFMNLLSRCSPYPAPSSGLVFPLSPSGFSPFPNTRWRDQ
ncbi:hypothetical protein Goari_026337 [Gossypium aridum]|uniref:VQ domain-containing protein n=1 Tax=Gossypium aridum TaxID=34290 RepID=A0A7J8XCX9_GOSAI|nr:hypothetical protein [Gossypium aridum]